MIEQKADRYFQGPEKYNCAQAVLKTFQQEIDICQEKINSFKKAGGGKAENGLCGALYAAKNITEPEIYADVEKEFISIAGSKKCKEIRKERKLTCRECVVTTAKLLSDIRCSKNNEADKYE